MNPHDRAISRWLLLCLAMIFAMVILGGVTRLTGSGLSMVHWKPVRGVLPPLNSEQWQEEFGFYQKSPEFQKINRDMGVDAFKSIFWLEYTHRMLGRAVGLVFLLPFLYFWWRNRIKPGLTPKLMVMFVLGGLQGLLGWYMVKSGLIDNPNVSQYRLTAHLLSAILIYGFILWVILDLRNQQSYLPLSNSQLRRWRIGSLGLVTLLLITITSGGFVAGLKAGLIFNTFPLMDGRWVPEGLAALTPWYLNLFENSVTVQFDHRLLAITTALLLLIWYLKGRAMPQSTAVRRSFKLIGMGVIIQVTLGIGTLLMQVPVWLGVMHQAGALLLFSVMLANVHALSRY
ncbi:MAG: COX15/CtaA family protein [Proteobacteria bacterium]|nr:COX15/CtaA family protein [Pseudomonadota bacterium]